MAASLPLAPQTLTNDVAITSAGKVGMQWQVPAYDGGSPVLDYTISYSIGSGAVTVLASGITQTSFTAN
jgi:hypothetical protein